MPAVKLVNIAPSAPIAAEAEAFLHNPIRGSVGDGSAPRRVGAAFVPGEKVPVFGWKPLPRDPTASDPVADLGPTFTRFQVVDGPGTVFDPEQGRMVNKDRLTADDHSRIIRHDWAMHSDCALPAFVLPADAASDEDIALARAVAARFNAKAPDQAKAEQVGQAFQLTGRSAEDADRAWKYHQSAVGLECKLWLPSDDAADPLIPTHELLQLLAAQEQEQWDEVLGRIDGPTALLVNGGRDAVMDGHFATYVYIGLTATSTAPSASDTSLTGQITTASGGLVAGAGTHAHTAGTSTSTLTKTHTANGSDSLPVTVAQVGVRNASGTGGTMATRTLLSSTATLSSSGDALTTTMTTTLTPS